MSCDATTIARGSDDCPARSVGHCACQNLAEEIVAALPAPVQPGREDVALALDKFEQAAMAYERLGKIKRDDEKSRDMRKQIIADLADARSTILALFQRPAAQSQEPVAYQYQYSDPRTGQPIWLKETFWNGNRPSASRALYTAPPDAEAIRREAVEKERERCARIVEGEVFHHRYRTWPAWGTGNRAQDSELGTLTAALAAAIRATEGER